MPKEVRNEQAKLTATFLNNIAVAVFVVGVLAPFVATLYAGAVPPQLQFIGSAVCIAGSIALHLGARLVLRSIRP